MTYLIEATIVKNGGTVVHWKRYSNTKLTKKECLKILGDDKHTRLEEFSCKKVKMKPEIVETPMQLAKEAIARLNSMSDSEFLSVLADSGIIDSNQSNKKGKEK